MADETYLTYVWTVCVLLFCLLLYLACARSFMRENTRGDMQGHISNRADVVVVQAQSVSPRYPTAEATLRNGIQSATPTNAVQRGDEGNVVYVSRVEVVQEQKTEDIDVLFV